MRGLWLVLWAVACGGPVGGDKARDTAASPTASTPAGTTPGGSTTSTPPPDAPVVAIAPPTPDTTADLIAGATASATVRWAWTVDGVDAGVEGSTVPAARTSRGETWTALAVATGPGGDSPPGTASVSIVNAPPVGEVTVEAGWTDADLVATPTAVDPDDDGVSWSWAWTVDGVDAGVDGAVVSAALTAPGQLWAVTATPHDGMDSGAPVVVEAEVGDRPPTVAVVLSPEVADRTDVLRAVVEAADPDGLGVSVSLEWSVDGVVLGSGSELAGGFVAGDTVVVDATASDGRLEAVASDSITIDNAPPVATDVAIVPAFPRTTDDVVCEATGTDADGDALTWTFAWTVSGADAGGTPSLAADAYVKSDTLVCVATPHDGVDSGTPGEDDTFVRNTPPALGAVWLVPERPGTTESVTVAYDPPVDPDESDALTVEWTWTVDGAPRGAGELPPEAFGPGAVLVATVVASDGTGASSPVLAEGVVNWPPVVTLALPAPIPDAPLVAEWSVSDADDDPVIVSWSWTVDGEPVFADGAVLDLPLAPDAVVRATLTADDGRDRTVVSAEVAGDNRPPEPADVRLTPEFPLAGDAVQCAADTPADPDGDPVSVTLMLELNGEPVESIDWLDTAMDDAVRCVATASDETHETVSEASLVVGPPRSDNYLIVLADDMGTDKVAVYDEFHDPPRTPNIDALAGEGVLFRNAYAATVCSPSRAQLLTGRHARRTGLGQVIRPLSSDYQLSLDEHILPELVAGAGWSSAVVGKWHLSGFLAPDPGLHPLVSGFDHHRGALGNPDQTLEADDVGGYYEWEYWVDGERSTSRDYITTVNVDDALMYAATLPEPWVIFVSLSAPHAPYEPPPDELLSAPYDPDIGYWEVFDVMIEAMDTELGRLLDGVDRSRTTVVFAGDNGTPEEFVRAPWDPLRAKGTIFEAAINVPLIVAGPDVAFPGSESAALVHIVDLFGTAQHLAGIPTRNLPNPVDSVSLLPHLLDPDAPSQRKTVASEWFVPFDAGDAPLSEMLAVRDERYKFVRLWDASFGVVAERMYDLEGVYLEGDNLLDGALSPSEEAARAALSAAADAHQALR
ncbi:MAG: arylsulfatase B [Myxococcota bacterium]|jgi:arylsulfatase B